MEVGELANRTLTEMRRGMFGTSPHVEQTTQPPCIRVYLSCLKINIEFKLLFLLCVMFTGSFAAMAWKQFWIASAGIGGLLTRARVLHVRVSIYLSICCDFSLTAHRCLRVNLRVAKIIQNRILQLENLLNLDLF